MSNEPKLSEKQKEVVKAMREGDEILYEFSEMGHACNFQLVASGDKVPFVDFFGLVIDKLVTRKKNDFVLTPKGKQIKL